MSSLSDVANWLAKRFNEIRTRKFIAEDGFLSVAMQTGSEMAAAFLETPGVEVLEQVGTFKREYWMPADWHYGIPATHRRIVIMLPAEKILRSDTGDNRSLPCVECGIRTPDAQYCTVTCGLPFCDNCRTSHELNCEVPDE